jgi:cytochrome d ubiquinol oxidase subunit I
VSLCGGDTAIRRREIPQNRTLLKAIVLAGPMGFLAIEAGWVVTEVGGNRGSSPAC